MQLRSQLIKLAYSKPELQEYILPLLSKQAAAFSPSFTKLRDGSWGVKILDADYRRGSTITVSTKSGKTKRVTLDKKLWSGKDRYSGGAQVALVTIQKNSGSGSSGSPSRRRGPGGTYECDECGDYVKPGTRCWETGATH